MKVYKCVFSKYDDSKLVLKELNFNPTDMKTSLVIEIEAISIKEAFEKCIKMECIDTFWGINTTIYPFYVNYSGILIYYFKQFNLY